MLSRFQNISSEEMGTQLVFHVKELDCFEAFIREEAFEIDV
jgi:hypothetical protein